MNLPLSIEAIPESENNSSTSDASLSIFRQLLGDSMRNATLIFCACVILSVAACSQERNPDISDVSTGPDYSPADLERCREMLKECSKSIRQIEFVLEQEGPGTKSSRIGPVVVTDKDMIAEFQKSLGELGELELNAVPFEVPTEQGDARVTIVTYGVNDIQCRVFPDRVAMWDSEICVASLPEFSKLQSWLQRHAAKFAQSHPERVLLTP